MILTKMTRLNTKLLLPKIIGNIYGDGSVVIRKTGEYRVQYTNQNKELINFFRIAAEKIFGYRGYLYETEDKRMNRRNIYRDELDLSKAGFGHVLEIIGNIQNIKCKHAFIPERMFKWRKYQKAIFLQSLFDDDGSVWFDSYSINNTQYKYLKIDLAAYNVHFLKQIKKILEEFSIVCFIRNRKTNTPDLRITRKKSILQFKKHIGFHHPKKKERLDVFIEEHLKKKRKREEKLNYDKLVTLDGKPYNFNSR